MNNQFLSFVIFEEDINDFSDLSYIKKLSSEIGSSYSDYEILIVLNTLETPFHQVENIVKNIEFVRVIKMAYPVHRDESLNTGLELAIGDFVVFLSPQNESIEILEKSLTKALNRNKLLIGVNESPRESIFYKILKKVFRLVSIKINYLIPSNISTLIIVPRPIVNTVCEGYVSDLDVTHKLIKSSGAYDTICYSFKEKNKRTMFDGILTLFNFLIFNSLTPLRFMTLLGILASMLSLVISMYTVISYFVIDNTVPGWTSLQLSISLLFSVLFIVLAFLNEYIGRVLRDQKTQKNFKVTGEISSNVLINSDRLNIKKDD